MAKRLVKCLYCNEMFNPDEEPYVKPRSNRYAHASCAESLETQEDKDKKELENYIKDLFRINCISEKIDRQINTYVKDKKYTYSGILKTLKYFYDVCGNDLEKSNGGIGITPYVYEEAYAYWHGIWEAQQKNENIELQDYVLPAREIHIKASGRKPVRRFKNLFDFLDKEEDVSG